MAKAAKNARDMHATSADIVVVEKIDVHLAEIQSKHTQIAQMVTLDPRPEVHNRMRELEASRTHTASKRSPQVKTATRNNSDRKAHNDVAHIKKKKVCFSRLLGYYGPNVWTQHSTCTLLFR